MIHGATLGGRRVRTHGASKSPAYRSWYSMMSRCYREDHQSFCRYGGRGISVCERWRNSANFIADMGQPKAGQQLDRIDNNGNYEPGNCRWVSREENCNNKSNTRLVSWMGEMVPLAALCRRLGIDYQIVKNRITRGWDETEAISRPINKRTKSWC